MIRLVKTILALIILLSSSSSAMAISTIKPTDGYFKNSNYQLHYETCDESQAPIKAATGSQPASTGSGGAGGCGEYAGDSKANKDQVWSYFNNEFRRAGYTPDEAEKATSGIMGNWQQESGFNPDRHNAPNPGSGCDGASGPITQTVGLGIAQWCGSRQQDLADFAAGKGGDQADISCLSTQLEFTWQEMEDRDLINIMKGKSAAEASQTFDEIFEVSEGSGERQAKGEAIYKEYTGKEPSALGNSGGGGGGGASDSCEQKSQGQGQQTNNPIGAAECAEQLKKYDELVASGKIKEISPERQGNDKKNCTTGPIECNGGVNPNLLRAQNAAAENSGEGTIFLWSWNTGHDCDGLNHPNGKAVDIPCGYGDAHTISTPEDKCRRIIDYLLLHKEELGITELLWNTNYKCNEGVDCTVDGHADHIHLGVRG